MIRGNRNAFTLVELLVVITIIGMLTAMIFPAVNMAREAARRMICSSNQKQVATALLNYESQRGQFPGYVNRVGNSQDNWMEASWVVMLQPFLDRNDLWQIWSRGWDNGNTTLLNSRCRSMSILVCPSDPPDGQLNTDTPTNYAVNGGKDGRDNNVAGTNPLSYGVFHCNGLYSGGGAMEKFDEARSTLDYISTHDGAAYTILFGENVANRTWADMTNRTYTAATKNTSTGVITRSHSTSTGQSTWTHERLVTLNYNWTAGSETTVPSATTFVWNKINGDRLYLSVLNAGQRIRSPSSFHPGGAVVSFCDGHQQFIKDSISSNTYWHLMTPYGAGAWRSTTTKYGPDGVFSDSDID